MVNWGKTMRQTYTSYTPASPGNYYGMTIPNKVFEHNLIVNDAPTTMSWYNENSQSTDKYQVVACYSDSNDQEHGAKMIHHLYLFTIVNNQPIVLITQQSDVNSENKLYFHETNNQSLKENFTNIIEN